MALTDLTLQPDYDRDNCPDIVEEFYVPVLAQATLYERTTYTFSAGGLVAAARGLERFLEHKGQIRLICDQSIDQRVLDAIKAGRQQADYVLRQLVGPQSLTEAVPEDLETIRHLELLTWLVAQGRIDIKIAYKGGDILFHDKTGIMTDANGNVVAFTGSANETRKGWVDNYESINVFSSWQEPSRVERQQQKFNRLWHNRSGHVHVEPIPDDYVAHLRDYAPLSRPAKRKTEPEDNQLPERHWQYVDNHIRHDPASTIATVPARLWPHQKAFFVQHSKDDDVPIRKLIADEVGLGKTLQAASLLKWRINQSRAKRFLILTPAGSRYQWQDELYDRFNLSVPVMERINRRTVLTYPDGRVEDAPPQHWQQPQAIVSYSWARHGQQAQEMLQQSERYDFMVVDEAHHARFETPNNPNHRGPNQYLQLLNRLAHRTHDLLLLTATPMQIAAVELWCLINLLEPGKWPLQAFEDLYHPEAANILDRWILARHAFRRHAERPSDLQSHAARIVWQDHEEWVINQVQDDEVSRAETITYMRQHGPVSKLMSRHTRELLKEYQRLGYDTAVPERNVTSVPIDMTTAERKLYEGVKPLIEEVYRGRPGVNPQAFGFISTTFHTRIGSSFSAYARSLRKQLERRFEAKAADIAVDEGDWQLIAQVDADEQDDQTDVADLIPAISLTSKQIHLLQRTVEAADRLSFTDSKFQKLRETLDSLYRQGHRRIIVFTQFRDTQSWLEHQLANAWTLTCLHGADRQQYRESRAKRLEHLRDNKQGGLLLCTESASESLNLQFCTALVNYDIPWNPMRLEQRIGRIDRIGQLAEVVQVVNLYYQGTAEWRAYQAMRRRLEAITGSVGPYRPILDATMPSMIRDCIDGSVDDSDMDDAMVALTSQPIADLDEWHITGIADALDDPRVDYTRLTALAANQMLLPQGWFTSPAGINHWSLTGPDGQTTVVTADPDKYDPDAVDWFGPGNEVFDTLRRLHRVEHAN